MHALTTSSVDMVLALLLIVGGVIGAQIGARVGLRLKAEQLRILLALLVLAVAGKIALDLLLHAGRALLGRRCAAMMARLALALLIALLAALAAALAAETIVAG